MKTHGVAAHWQYKALRVSDHQRINWLRGLLDWQKFIDEIAKT